MAKRKPKPKQKQIWSASQIKQHLESKFNAKNDKFWQWFFSEAPWGETNLLDLGDPEFYEFKDKKVNEYFAILKDEFYDKNNEEMEIQNDL